MRLLTLVAVLFPCLSLAQVPAKLAYQGRLIDASGSPQAGVVTMQFAVWDAPTAGNQLWCETQSVALTAGFYAVTLGDGTACSGTTGTLATTFSGVPRFLEITIGTSALTPRQAIDSVPFALVAGTAASLSPPSDGYVRNQAASAQGASFNIDGTGSIGSGLGIATASPAARLHAVGAAPVAGSGFVSFVFGQPTNLQGDANTKFTTEVSPGDIIVTFGQTRRVTAVTANDSLTVDVAWTGTGFANKAYTVQKPIARFHAASGPSAALMINSQGSVGIGTNIPQVALDVNGKIRGQLDWDGSRGSSENHAFCVSDGYTKTRYQAAQACKALNMRLCTLAELSAYAEADYASCCWGWVADPGSNNSATSGKVAYFMYSSATTQTISSGCGGTPGGMRIQDNIDHNTTWSAYCCQ